MKAAALRNLQARKQATRFDWTVGARNRVTETVLTWCFKCERPTEHTQEDVVYPASAQRERTCTVCGTNKDAGR